MPLSQVEMTLIADTRFNHGVGAPQRQTLCRAKRSRVVDQIHATRVASFMCDASPPALERHARRISRRRFRRRIACSLEIV